MKYQDSERIVRAGLFLAAISASLFLLFIVLFLIKESLPFISGGDLLGFFTGTKWAPAQNIYGAGIFIIDTVLTTLGALAIALPLGLACAIFLAEVAPRKVADALRPAIELLAGIPSIVYGLFALVVIVGLVQSDAGKLLGVKDVTTGRGILATSVILGIIVLPIVISISQDAITAVPRSYREASYGMGATRWQTIRSAVLPAAMPGIIAGAILGIGRAFGETMAVVLVLGNVGIIPTALVGSHSTGESMTSAIILEMGYASVGSMHYAALFMLGLVLFVMAFGLSYLSERIASVRRTK